ncbi:MAG: hypothetical protein FJY75_09715 [Candidatus Eisenbacteria bacterium]|uniref:Bacterial surface antigen (D15) domain-containing protein n=1 Tax=Eiseniibacteriota bacterium TaxID=2212470 RepID=A0A937X9E8_UNCEI|nr:hypothetical protein [Candidatus Eisenbacteria bacterium]
MPAAVRAGRARAGRGGAARVAAGAARWCALALLCAVTACASRGGTRESAPEAAGAARLLVRGAMGESERRALAGVIGDAQGDSTWPPGATAAWLAARGFLSARLARYPDSLWVIDPGQRISAVRLAFERSGVRPAAGETEARAGADAGLGDTGWAAASGGEGANALREPTLPAAGAGGWVAAVESALAEELRRLADEGRPLARLALAGARWDAGARGPSPLELRFEVAPGPLARVRAVRFESDGPTRSSFLERVIGWRGEEIYRGDRWRGARRELLGTGLLLEASEALLVVGPSPREEAGDTLDVEVLFRLRERRANAIAGILGYADRRGEEGERRGRLSGFVDLALGNLLGTGRSARVFWQALGEDRSRFELAWREPYLWRLPLGAQVELSHMQEDTLFADTRWSGGLSWKPGPEWRIGVGWSRSRLVMGADVAATLSRRAASFTLERSGRRDEGGGAGWRLSGSVEHWAGDGPGLRRAALRVGEWVGRGSWLLVLEQQAGLAAGPTALLRSDAFLVGGSGSLRGSFEGEFRAWRHLVHRMEVGPRIDARGGRAYLLCDLAWLERWEASTSGLYGVEGGDSFHGALGAGVELAGRAGLMRLEYAVPNGASPARGRIHIGLGGVF